MIQSFQSRYSLLGVIGQEPVHKVEPILSKESGRELFAEVVVWIVGEGNLQQGKVRVQDKNHDVSS